MKQHVLFICIVATSFAFCNNASKQIAETPAADSPKAIAAAAILPREMCFAASGKDSALMKLTVTKNDSVTGSLLYKLFEKDTNTGSLEGMIKGDTLLADYTFMSEGIASTRQVIFLLKDSTAVEGYGAAEEKDKKMVFKNLKEVTFGKGLLLHKTACMQ